MGKNIKVFLLTEEWRERNAKNELVFMAVPQEGKPVEIIINNFRPVFFIQRESKIPTSSFISERKPVNMKTFEGKPLDALYFRSQYDLKNYEEILRKSGVQPYESDINPSQRYLMERFINLGMEITGDFKGNENLETFINPEIKPCKIIPEFKILSLDIETSGNGKQLYSIAVTLKTKNGITQKVFIIDRNKTASSSEVESLDTETELIEAFIKFIKIADPDIIIGWHVIGFDLMFLEKKCAELKINFNISRGNSKHLFRKKPGRSYFAYIPGRIVFDGPITLRTAFYNFPDFRLETVARELLGKGKSIAADEDKVSEIERMFAENKAELAKYNLLDTSLVIEIFEKTGIIEQSIKRGILSGLLLDRLGMMTAAFDHFMLPRIHRAGYAAPNVEDINKRGHSAGGFVFEPEPGIYNNVAVFDFKSLYPSIIRTFKIDPYSLLENAKDTRETPNGFKFSYSENFLPVLISRLMEQRENAKAAGDKYLSQAVKILMNSFYGVMGSYGCRFYNPALPSSITGTGKWLLLNCKEFLKKQGYRTLYGDTDSLFVELKDGEDETRAKHIAIALNNFLSEELENKFKVKSYLEIEYEKLYEKFVLTSSRGAETGAKKRYAGLLNENGTYKIDFVGMEFVRSDWTQLAKDFQNELYLRYFKGEEIDDWIRGLVKSIKTGKMDEKLIYKKRLRRETESYVKNIPPHIKAAKMLSKKEDYIEYYITKNGPVPVKLLSGAIDYHHYIEKQLQPIADSLLMLTGRSFNDIIKSEQMNFFE
ncbi:MAG: DNA polymerase II [Ignavibacteria bacterium]|nr:DNA polymerase II [Ignavibacteria bacterium]